MDNTSSYGSQFHVPLNPLMIDVILRNLADYIPKNKNLLNFRQVSTIWNQAAQAHLNFDRVVCLRSNQQENSRIPTISEFNKIWQNEERWMDMPFYRFRFEMMEDSVLDPAVQEFFYSYGPQLKDLEISFGGSGNGTADECYAFLENLISIQAKQLERVYVLGENLLRILKLEGSNLHLVICFEPNASNTTEELESLKKSLDRIFNVFIFLFRKYSRDIQNLLISIRISHECEDTQKYQYNSLARKFVCDLMGTEIQNLNLKGFQLTCDNWDALNGIESSLTNFLIEQRKIIEYFSIAGKVDDSLFDRLGFHYFPKLVVLDIEDRSSDETQIIKRRLTRARC